MSADQNEDDCGNPGGREVAYRLFAAEFDDADVAYSESDEERAPNYVITPTGGRVNRVFVVGVLTEVQPAGEDILRARVADPTGTFVVYAGQYQPDAQTFLERAEPPAYVAVTGKARTFEPEDSDVIYTSIRPESLNEVEEAIRDRWTVQTARQTLERVGTMATALQLDGSGDALTSALRERNAPEGLAAGIPLAIEHYGTTPGYLAAVRQLAISAAEIVAGERETVDSLALAPDEGGQADLKALSATAGLAQAEAGGEREPQETETAEPGTTSAEPAVGQTGDQPTDAAGETVDSDEPGEEPDAGSETVGEPVEASGTDSAVPTGGDEPEQASERDGKSGEQADTAEAPDMDAETVDEQQETDGSSETADQTQETGGAGDSADRGDFDGEFELDEAEREEIKAEFGTDFTSGADVQEPGVADIDTPEPDEVSPDEASITAESTGPNEATAPSTEETADDRADSTPDSPDLEDAVMDAMKALDDGDGADREAVIEHVSDEHDEDSSAVETAIQEALMDGRCYEPGEGTLKPI